MKSITEKVITEINEMKSICTKVMCDESVFMSMDSTTLALLQSCFRLIDASTELMAKQAYVMEEQSEKLDMLLNLMEKERAQK